MSNKPIEIVRDGVLSISIWKNENTGDQGEVKTYLSYNLEKSYKHGEEWKYTTSFSMNDLARFALMIPLAFVKTLELKAQLKTQALADGTPPQD